MAECGTYGLPESFYRWWQDFRSNHLDQIGVQLGGLEATCATALLKAALSERSSNSPTRSFDLGRVLQGPDVKSDQKKEAEKESLHLTGI